MATPRPALTRPLRKRLGADGVSTASTSTGDLDSIPTTSYQSGVDCWGNTSSSIYRRNRPQINEARYAHYSHYRRRRVHWCELAQLPCRKLSRRPDRSCRHVDLRWLHRKPAEGDVARRASAPALL